MRTKFPGNSNSFARSGAFLAFLMATPAPVGADEARAPVSHRVINATIDAVLSAKSPPRLRDPSPEARASAVASLATTRPHIVVLMTDDLDERDLNLAIENGFMPNLEAHLISQGVHFSESFVSNPLCCPSRATFLTGQYAHNNGVYSSDFVMGGGVTFLEDESTVATWLQTAGYRTGFVGKYLNGYGLDRRQSPRDDLDYVPPGWDDWQGFVGHVLRLYN